MPNLVKIRWQMQKNHGDGNQKSYYCTQDKFCKVSRVNFKHYVTCNKNYISIMYNVNHERFTTCTYNGDEECLSSAEEVKIKCRQLVFWSFCFSYFSYLFSGRKNCHPWRLCITGKIKENLGFPFFFFLIFLSPTFLDICIYTREKISPESKVPLQEKWPWGNIDGPR